MIPSSILNAIVGGVWYDEHSIESIPRYFILLDGYTETAIYWEDVLVPYVFETKYSRMEFVVNFCTHLACS